MLRLFLLFPVVLAYDTEVYIQVNLQCRSPFSNEATVFLMERDCSHCLWPLNELDPDDEIDHGTYPVNEQFDMRGTIQENGQMELYLFVGYNFRNGYQERIFELGAFRRREVSLIVTVDLDREKVQAQEEGYR